MVFNVDSLDFSLLTSYLLILPNEFPKIQICSQLWSHTNAFTTNTSIISTISLHVGLQCQKGKRQLDATVTVSSSILYSMQIELKKGECLLQFALVLTKNILLNIKVIMSNHALWIINAHALITLNNHSKLHWIIMHCQFTLKQCFINIS